MYIYGSVRPLLTLLMSWSVHFLDDVQIFIHFKKRKRLRILTSSPITEDTVAPFMWMSSAKTETYLGHSSETQQ